MPIASQLLEVLKYPQADLLINKYRGEFEVDEFVRNL